MDYKQTVNNVLHWNYRGFTEFPLHCLQGEEAEITDIYLKENLISRIPCDIGKLNNLESLYLSGNDITELPREISKLSRLKCLDLSGNRLQYIPAEIGEMRNLKFLILDENELRELPLRVAELRMLRYLSVCGVNIEALGRDPLMVQQSVHRQVAVNSLEQDNKLQWLPQRPVYNYHHCEFRFWRNRSLSALPYSLWYHMFRGQQTRSLNIGCLSISVCDDAFCSHKGRFVLRLGRNVEESDRREINFPKNYEHILNRNTIIIPNLMELCKRKFYEMLNNASNRLSTSPISIYSDVCCDERFENNNYIQNLQEYFKIINLTNGFCDKNKLNEDGFLQKSKEDTKLDKLVYKNKKKGYCVPSDIIEEYFYYLPKFLKDDFCNGPLSRCENVSCRKPVFDFVYFEFCLEKIVLIENTEDVLLYAVFCSKSCAGNWRTGKAVVTWKFT